MKGFAILKNKKQQTKYQIQKLFDFFSCIKTSRVKGLLGRSRGKKTQNKPLGKKPNSNNNVFFYTFFIRKGIDQTTKKDFPNPSTKKQLNYQIIFFERGGGVE